MFFFYQFFGICFAREVVSKHILIIHLLNQQNYFTIFREMRK